MSNEMHICPAEIFVALSVVQGITFYYHMLLAKMEHIKNEVLSLLPFLNSYG